MFRVKTLPAVITAVLLLFIAWLSAPAHALADVPHLQSRLARFDDTGADLDKRIIRLTQKARQGHVDAAFRSRVVAADRDLLRLNRSVVLLSRAVLALPEADAELVSQALALNRDLRRLDRDALWMNHHSLRGSRLADLNGRISRRYAQLDRIGGRLETKAKKLTPAPEPYQPAPDPTSTVSPTPDPTATPEPSSSPSPAPEPQPTTSPAPEPSSSPAPEPQPPVAAEEGPAVPAGYTLVRDQTIQTLTVSGLAKRYYYRCTFTGGSSTQAVLTILSGSELVFDSCTIAAGGGWNGVSINDADGRIVRDITFRNCLFQTQGRMGFECTNRGTLDGYQRVNLIGCLFEPQGSEAVSYDDSSGGKAGWCEIRANTLQGAGVNPVMSWGQGLEINGPRHMTVVGNRVYQCREQMFNLQMHTTQDCGWFVKDNVLDASSSMQNVLMRSDRQAVGAINVVGGVFSGNVVVTKAPGGGVAWMSGCRNMDWRTTTWRDASGRTGYSTPTQVNCSGNLF